MLMELTIPPFPVYCSIDQYIVIQRRTVPFDMSFNRTWDEYKNGFSDLNGEFWLCLEKLYRITNQPHMTYKVGKLFYDEWSYFYIGGENEQYMIKSTGSQGVSNVNGHQYSYSCYYFGVPSNSKFFTRDKDDDTTVVSK